MKQTNGSGRTGLLIVTGIVAAIVIAAMFYLADYLNSAEPTTIAEAVPTPIIGSTAGPAKMAAVAAESQSGSPVAVDPAAITPGDSVQVVAQDSGNPRLYNDASRQALIMDMLSDGEQLTVIEPSSDYAAYPVQNKDGQWIRVRAGDGLAGWVQSEVLVIVE